MERVSDVERLVLATGMREDLGIEFTDLSPVRLVASMLSTELPLPPLGFQRSGISLTLAECVAMVGGWLNSSSGQTTLCSSINATHLKPIRAGERLWAVGIPDYVGSDKQVWAVDIRDETGELVSSSRCTLDVADLPESLPRQ